MPEVTENPPMPPGQALVMMMLVGTRRVNKLKLIPACALDKRADQKCRILTSLLLYYMVLLSCRAWWSFDGSRTRKKRANGRMEAARFKQPINCSRSLRVLRCEVMIKSMSKDQAACLSGGRRISSS